MRRRVFLTGAFTAALAAPVQAQRAKFARIAYVSPGSSKASPFVPAFLAALQAAGYKSGEVTLDFHWGEGQIERYDELVRHVISTRPDVVVAISSTMVQRFKDASTAIPIVALTADPIALGLVASLARPGGNLTGVVTDAGIQIWAKRIDLLKQISPTTARAALLTPRSLWDGAYGAGLRKIGQESGIEVSGAVLEGQLVASEYHRAFAQIRAGAPDALLVSERPENFINSRLIGQLAVAASLPTVTPERTFTEAGSLMSYGTNVLEMYRHLGRQTARILSGTFPGDLPFHQPTAFELVINLQTAKAIGLAISQRFLALADEVID
jgi:putative ABC transport system substrate-binding protein